MSATFHENRTKGGTRTILKGGDGMGTSKKEIVETAKDFQEKEKGGADSSKQFAAAGHQQRQDDQKSGGNLPKRDLSTKEDVPDKEEKEADDSESKK